MSFNTEMAQDAPNLGSQMVRTVAIFQAIIAGPIAFVMSLHAFVALLAPGSTRSFYYDFFTDVITSLMAESIIFIVIVQRHTKIDVYKSLILEASKSAVATGLWLWLLLDSALGPWKDRPDIDKETLSSLIRIRVARAITAVILLFVLFYPAFVYYYMVWKRVKNFEDPDHRIELHDIELAEDEEALLSQVD